MPGPLTGVRVVDVTHVLAGSYCSMLLADMGADVVKVERPGGAEGRGNGRDDGFAPANRNKRSLVVDLRRPDGQRVAKRLAECADVWVENFRPGALDSLGLGCADLSALNPALVYCSISGFGATGPYRARRGFDIVAQGAVFDAIERFHAPVVAAVNGAAIGGELELALCCDLRTASTDAIFVAAGVNVGLIANFYRLPRIVGEGPAKDLLLTGRQWTAEEALRWGLVTAIHEPDALLDAAHRLARRISTRPPLSVEATKDAVREMRHASLDEAATLQGERFAAMFRTEDHAEAIRAFLEKRHAEYHRR